MAFLDENNNAKYQFYGQFRPDLVKLPETTTNKDIIYIGDFVSLLPGYENIVSRIPKEAIVYYDPNTRSDMDDEAFKQFMNNVSRANIVRFSNEDLDIVNKKIDIIPYLKK